MEGHNPKKKDNRIWKAAGAAALAVLLISLAAVGIKMSKQGQPEPGIAQSVGEDINGGAVEEAVEDGDVPEEELGEEDGEDPGVPEYLKALMEMGVPVPEKEVDFGALQEDVNKDIYAWLYIPDSKIDYPILQHPSNDLYYLNYNLDGSYGYPGCIYTERYNAKDFSDPLTVVYGHNMKNGTMFAGLHNFEDSEYFTGHPYVYVYTPEKLYVYEIFAAHEYSSEHLLYGMDYTAESVFKKYINKIMDIRDMNCNRAEDVEVTVDSHILVLSTCIANKPDNRYLVQGVLLNED